MVSVCCGPSLSPHPPPAAFSLLPAQPSYELTVPGQWDDISGNGAHGRTLTAGPKPFLVKDESGNGSSIGVTYVAGSPSTRVVFGAPIPTLFTICSVSRYTRTTPPYGRIITGSTGAPFLWRLFDRIFKRGFACPGTESSVWFTSKRECHGFLREREPQCALRSCDFVSLFLTQPMSTLSTDTAR